MGYIKDIKIGSGTANLIEPVLYAVTSGSASAYTASISNFELVTGVVVTLKISADNAANATLKINSSDAKNIIYKNANITANALSANRVYSFLYDGSSWQLIGELDTTYNDVTTSTHGLMSTADKTKLDTLKDAPFIMGTQTQNTAHWTGTASTLTNLVNGQTIYYYLPYNIKSTEYSDYTFNNITTSGVTLELTLADSNKTEPLPVFYQGMARVTSQYMSGALLVLTYIENAQLNGSIIGSGWWVHAQYNTDTSTQLRWDSATIIAGTAGIFPRTLIMMNSDGRYESIVTSASTSNSKTRNTAGFLPHTLLYYSGTQTITNGNSISSAGSIFQACPSLDFRYSANTSSTPLTSNEPVFLIGTIGNNGAFYLEDPWWTQQLPQSDDNGRAYMYVGIACGTTSTDNITLNANHPIFMYKNNGIREISTYAINLTAADIGAVAKSGDTMTGTLTLQKFLHPTITGTGTAGVAYNADTSTNGKPALWKFNLSTPTPAAGDIITITVPVAGHSNGVFISTDNGAHYKPVSVSGASRLTTHFGKDTTITLVYDSNGKTNSVYPVNGGTAPENITGGCWRVLNYYDSNTTYSAMTQAEAWTGTADTSRTMRADYLKDILAKLGGTNLTLTHDANGIVLNHDSSGVTATNSPGFYKVQYDTQGHITGTADVVKNDITDLLGTDSTHNYKFLRQDGTWAESILNYGYGYRNGSQTKKYFEVLTFTQKVNSTDISTRILLLISKYFASENTGILSIQCRWNKNTTTPNKYQGEWIINTLEDSNTDNFILTHKYNDTTKTVTLKLYAYINSSTWGSYHIVKLSEHSFGLHQDQWELNFAMDNFAYENIPSDETQINITYSTIKNTATAANYVDLNNVANADDLKAIEALTGTAGILKKTNTNTWALLDITPVSAVTSTDKAIVRFNGTYGQVQNSGITISDDNRLTINHAQDKQDGVLIKYVTGATTTASFFMGVGQENQNYGIYDYMTNKWVLSSSNSQIWKFYGNIKGQIGASTAQTDAPGPGEIQYLYDVNKNYTGFSAANNANSIITLNNYTSGANYCSQLGVSSNGNLYYRSFSGKALDTTTEWKQIAFTDGTIANATNLVNAPSLAVSNTTQITVTAGGKTSSAFTVPFATSATSATSADKLTTIEITSENDIPFDNDQDGASTATYKGSGNNDWTGAASMKYAGILHVANDNCSWEIWAQRELDPSSTYPHSPLHWRNRLVGTEGLVGWASESIIPDIDATGNANGNLGTTSQPIYAKGGRLLACSYTLNVASSENTTSKIYLIGAESQSAYATTNSDLHVYATNGALSVGSLKLNANTTAEKVNIEYNTTSECITFSFE